ncbi:unnamed protein product [Heligmosomoides polygyrus]|uniref:Uncharacterized protein n=1 Tax=Heligmosomoides polygyrus TaxID=6339 RepID=A0A183G6D1_HELPZ|nr:unnamed protein product [Heligmosomoides polygyrus]
MEGSAHAPDLSAGSGDDPRASSPFPSDVKIEPNSHSTEEGSPPLNPMEQRKRVSKSDCDCSIAPKAKKERSSSLHLDLSATNLLPSSAAQTRSGIDDEVDMEGVSSYDAADAERNILEEMMGGGDGSLVAGVDLFSCGGRRSKKVLSHLNRVDG